MTFLCIVWGLTQSVFTASGTNPKTRINAKNKHFKNLYRPERNQSSRAKPQLWLRGSIRQGNQLLKPSQSAAFVSLPVLDLMDSPFWRRRVIKLHIQTSIKAIHLSEQLDSDFSGNSPIKPPYKATKAKICSKSEINVVLLQTGHVWIHPERAQQSRWWWLLKQEVWSILSIFCSIFQLKAGASWEDEVLEILPPGETFCGLLIITPIRAPVLSLRIEKSITTKVPLSPLLEWLFSFPPHNFIMGDSHLSIRMVIFINGAQPRWISNKPSIIVDLPLLLQ